MIGGLFPVILPKVGVPVFFCSIELNFRGCFRQDIEPAPCSLILRPDPELTEYVLWKGKGLEGMYFMREFLFNNAVVTDCVPDFFQLHYYHRSGAVYQPIE